MAPLCLAQKLLLPDLGRVYSFLTISLRGTGNAVSHITSVQEAGSSLGDEGRELEALYSLRCLLGKYWGHGVPTN